jgi:DNA modification methylase
LGFEKSLHGIYIQDAVQFLKKMPDNSVQLVLIDPPYNLDLDYWDTYGDYRSWAKTWLDEIYYQSKYIEITKQAKAKFFHIRQFHKKNA